MVVDAVRSPSGYRAPVRIASEPVVNTLVITAHNFRYDQDEYHVPPGLNEIHLVSIEGAHTLVFADRTFASVSLRAAVPGGRPMPPELGTTRVDLVAGRSYLVYDALPGHADSGEVATIVVDGPTTTTSTAP